MSSQLEHYHAVVRGHQHNTSLIELRRTRARLPSIRGSVSLICDAIETVVFGFIGVALDDVVVTATGKTVTAAVLGSGLASCHRALRGGKPTGGSWIGGEKVAEQSARTRKEGTKRIGISQGKLHVTSHT